MTREARPLAESLVRELGVEWEEHAGRLGARTARAARLSGGPTCERNCAFLTRPVNIAMCCFVLFCFYQHVIVNIPIQSLEKPL